MNGRMRYKIYHADRYEEAYEYVASVVASGKEDVWRIGNSIDIPWWENAEVMELSAAVKERGGARSMMVGDVVVNEFGEEYKVAGCGFKDVGKEYMKAREYAMAENYAGNH